MTKYIDAEHLKWNTGGINCGSLTVNYLHFIIDTQEPAINVVRCKDCKHYGTAGNRLNCNVFCCSMPENGFCSMGEEKTD